MGWFDAIIIGIILFSTYWSYSLGIILEITFFVGTIAGLLFAFLFYPQLIPFFTSIFGGRFISATISFILIFVVTGIGISILGLFVRKFIDILHLRALDRMLGAIAGVLKSVIAVSVFVVMISAIYPENPPSYLENSQLAGPIVQITAGTMESIPSVFSNFLEDYGNPALESLEHLRESVENGT